MRFVFFFKQKTAYEMRISDWSSDVCSSDLRSGLGQGDGHQRQIALLPHPGAARAAQGGGHAPASGEGHQHRLDRRHAPETLGNLQLPRIEGCEIGRESCRERGCQYVWISAVAASCKKQKIRNYSVEVIH